ncbi:putative polysaccharide biosynthesis protein [Bacillus pinisoli]|uniref:putative polysaccharide biosynthesis protein n=1 Tax=Bacillus pinisoli TaxID=2901866 RepID=UPI001FF58595|nr:polysaccharide biosynthesis protein [Bacillus pinisoli]
MSGSNLLRGTFILTLGTYISRVLGMIYVFPFVALVGSQGTALYSYGYLPYTIFLSLSTVGVPMAVSKFVSRYNALGDYHTSRRLFKLGMLLMLAMGVVSFIVLFIMAPVIAPMVLGEQDTTDTGVNRIEDVVYVIRMVSFALLVVPVMSVIRGFFQGHQSMEPTAISQVVEQLFRILFLLGSVYFILKVLNGELTTAIGYATFAAFIGALGGLLVLGWFWKKRKAEFNELTNQSVAVSDISTKAMVKELITYAGPFVFVGLAIPLYQLADFLQFNKTMMEIGNTKKFSEYVYSVIQFNVPKLIMIPVSLATAFGLTLVPAITKAFTDGDRKLLHTQINQSIQIVFFLTLPAVVGLAVLSDELYALFYNVDEHGSMLLAWYAPVAVLFAFFTITAAMLQGIQKQKLAVISLAFGLILKFSLNVPLIMLFGGIGSILATGIGYLGSVIYSLAMIKRHAQFSFRLTMKRSVLMIIFALMMVIGITIVMLIFSSFIDYTDGKWATVVLSVIGISAGAGIYLYLSYRSNLAGKLLGNRFRMLKRQKVNG